VRLTPSGLVARDFALDARGRHWWRPISPRAAVEVSFAGEAGWRGEGYFDTNWGAEPIEDAFSVWDWSRAHLARDTVLLYDIVPRNGDPVALALRVAPDGGIREVASPPRAPLAPTFWRLARTTRGDAGEAPRLTRTLEDTPFYARSMLEGRFAGEPARIVHESLDLNRLRWPVLRAMLPFRMPRRFW
jgi:carotenoid 1,2-hydratase